MSARGKTFFQQSRGLACIQTENALEWRSNEGTGHQTLRFGHRSDQRRFPPKVACALCDDRARHLRGDLQPSQDVLLANISLETAFVLNAPDGIRENFGVLTEWLV
jgi:hypothetical protein